MAEPTDATAKLGRGRAGRPSLRIACESISTPSPAMLKVPATSPRVACSIASIRSVSLRNCIRGSNPSTVGITGSLKYAVSGVLRVGPIALAVRSVVTRTSGRRRVKPRT